MLISLYSLDGPIFSLFECSGTLVDTLRWAFSNCWGFGQDGVDFATFWLLLMYVDLRFLFTLARHAVAITAHGVAVVSMAVTVGRVMGTATVWLFFVGFKGKFFFHFIFLLNFHQNICQVILVFNLNAFSSFVFVVMVVVMLFLLF